MTDARFLHGPLACRHCFPRSTGSELRLGDWRLTNNPGYYGSSTPQILVLGFSKGANQNRAAEAGSFDKIAFANARDRLQQVLNVLGIMPRDRSIDTLMTADEKEFGVASLVRCSFSKLKNGEWKTSGDVIPTAFAGTDTMDVIRACFTTHLLQLPTTVRLVVLLGTDERYIRQVTKLFRKHFSDWSPVNGVSFRTGRVLWTFATHPSPGNGHFKSWTEGPDTNAPGRKRELAKQALREHGIIAAA